MSRAGRRGHGVRFEVRLMGLRSPPSRFGRPPARLPRLPKKADPFYLSPEWRALRKEKLALGPPVCCACGTREGPFILDHRDERRDGGADLPALHETDWYCVGDHNRKTARAKARRVTRRGGGGKLRGSARD